MIQVFFPDITSRAAAAVAETLMSGWVGNGPRVREFESEFANYIGVPHCTALNSGTAALHLAIKSLNLPPGSEVITTPITFIATNMAILYENLVPMFADVDYGTLNIDVASTRKRINDRTRAIMAVHYGGQPCDLNELHDLAVQHGCFLIQDCAHACGASYNGRKIGSVFPDDLCAWSFHAVKNLTTGDGGAITGGDDKRLKRLRWLGIDRDTFERTESDLQSPNAWSYRVEEIGHKYEMNDIAATIGIEQLKVLDMHNSRRKAVVEAYRRELDGVVELPEFKPDRVSSNHLFVIKVRDRERFLERMKAHGVSCGVHYTPNNHYRVFRSSYLPVVESVYRHIVSLPVHTMLSNDDVEYVCQSVKESI